MAQNFSIDINPKVLQWARHAAGQSTSHVAQRLGISEQTVHQWEAGKKSPPWPTLRKLANYYQRPLAALLLPEPPREPEVPPDFRTLPDNRRVLSPNTLLAIRTARWLQSRAIEMRRELGVDPVFTTRRVEPTQKPDMVAEVIRKSLGIEIAEQSGWNSRHEAYRHWREAVDDQGVLVFQFPFPIKEVRGFSLFDPVCPVIVVSESDDPLARVFTLFHEYAHLLLQQPGICLPQETTTGGGTNVEPFCNRFAAAILIPDNEIKGWDIATTTQKQTIEAELKELAKRYWVSKYVILFRLAGIDRIAESTAHAIEKRWHAIDASRLPRVKTARSGGSPAVSICRRQRGRAFIDLVRQAEKRGFITTHDAVTYLGVKLNDLKKLDSTR